MRKNNAFSLIELMIVILIIGILVAIAMPNYSRSLERAKCSQAMHILKDMRSAGFTYFANNAIFPVLETDLEDEVGANFYADDSNPDWTFSITTGTATAFVVQAARQGGPHSGQPITITDNPTSSELWSGAYPRDNP